MSPKSQPRQIVPVEKIPQAEEVPLDDLLGIFRVCTQMMKVCLENDGIGLSAAQVGLPWKLFIVLRSDRKENFHYEYLLNCEYEGEGEKTKSIEGCLSLRDADGNLRRFEVERFSKIRVRGKRLVVEPELTVEDVDIVLDGLYAIVYQHEIDHQRGVLISDIGKEIELF